MGRVNQKLRLGARPLVVGTVHDLAGFRQAGRAVSAVDLCEVRVDSLPKPVSPEDIRRLALPAIVTVRDFVEGGSRRLPEGLRRELYLELLSESVAVDLEIRNLRAMRDVVTAAKAGGRKVIASFHDFQGVPSPALIRRLAAKARDAGADCVKVAAMTGNCGELSGLLRCVGALEDGPFALMGMGKLGAASRVLFAACGSCLNYGWLGSPQVPGQLPVGELAMAIASISGGSPRN
ncbi:MAG: type I 3-dehydroquinate dehydratase [Terrimicrobiaceae bacterium]